MTTTTENSAETLCREILADAQRESEQMLSAARQEAEDLLAKSVSETEKERAVRLDLAQSEASRRKELILATIPVEANRLRFARIEALLDDIREEVLQCLESRKGFDFRESVISLAAYAVNMMAGEEFIVRLSPEDRDLLGERLAEEITQHVERQPARVSVLYDSTVADGGPIIEDTEGHQVWDNHLSARLERLWPELRMRIALGLSLVPAVENKGDTP